jgi:hypothetical protein
VTDNINNTVHAVDAKILKKKAQKKTPTPCSKKSEKTLIFAHFHTQKTRIFPYKTMQSI